MVDSWSDKNDLGSMSAFRSQAIGVWTPNIDIILLLNSEADAQLSYASPQRVGGWVHTNLVVVAPAADVAADYKNENAYDSAQHAQYD